ncbi:MAG: serine/threonine protein kinase, partial [Deinococcota bacterium]
AAAAVLAQKPAAPARPITPTPAAPGTPAPVTPPVPTRTPEQYAQAAGQGARALDGQVYLPLSEVAGALSSRIELLTPRTATLTFPAQGAAAAQSQTVPVRYVNRVAFVPLAALAHLDGAALAARRAPAGVTLTLAGQTLTFPVNVANLTPLEAQPEFPALVRQGGGL